MKNDSVIDEEPGSHEVASLGLPAKADQLVRPAASIGDIETAFNEYQQLCARLLNEEDIQHIGSKSFRKKSAWRKLAVAFGVSCEVRERIYDRSEEGAILRAEVVVRATAPNGRFMDGLGICDISERRFSKPQHDVPATAMTRATNRACADLFGMGEVSAEEITDDGFEEATLIVKEIETPEWQKLGYVSEIDFKSQMEKLVESVLTLEPELREKFKSKRKAAKMEWPVPAAKMGAAERIVAGLNIAKPKDNEPF